MFLHVADAIQSGFRKVAVRTVDTDVLVLAVAFLDKLQTLTEEIIQLWVAFGTGGNLRYLAAHDIAGSFVNGAALALPAFHAFTRCDTVSCFHRKRKKTALDTRKCFPEVTPVFIALSNPQEEIEDDWMTLLERFVVLMYDRTSITAKTSTRPECNFSQGIPASSTQFNPHKMLCSSMSNALPTKQVLSGGKRSNQVQSFKVPNIGVGFLMTEIGDPCGPHCLKSPSLAKSW